MLGPTIALLAVRGHWLTRRLARTRRMRRGTVSALRTSLGSTAFAQAYGTNGHQRSAFGKCVANWTQMEHHERHKAATECAAERDDAAFAAAHGGKAFAQFYGTGKNGANAFGRCVAQKAQTQVKEDRADVTNAERKCKAQLKSVGATAFKAKYSFSQLLPGDPLNRGRPPRLGW